MKRKKITEDDRQAAIGRAYASGIRDGHNGTAYNNGSWLTPQARREADRAVEEVVEDHATMRDRIEAEYERHTPVLKPDRVRLGDSISEPRLLFSCAADGCREGWPCQTWHLLRHLASFDKTTYAIAINRQAPEDRPTGLHNDESKITPLTAPSNRDVFDYPQDYRVWAKHFYAYPEETKAELRRLAARYAHGYQED